MIASVIMVEIIDTGETLCRANIAAENEAYAKSIRLKF